VIECSFAVQQRLGELFGWVYTEGRHVEFLSRLEKAANDWGQTVEQFSDWLSTATLTVGDRERLIPYFAIGETYFFRDSRVFEFLKSHLMQASADHRPWRIWSAACSSGEEAYTLAMLLSGSGLRCAGSTVFGTDLNPVALAKASAGVYSNWSFRDCPESLKSEYFEKVDAGWLVKREVKELVRFSSINLVTDLLPSPSRGLEMMDVIFCRNVLMYFGEAQARGVIRRLRDCLRPNGLLFLSPTDAFFLDEGLFAPLPELNSVGYRKIEDWVPPSNPFDSEEALEDDGDAWKGGATSFGSYSGLPLDLSEMVLACEESSPRQTALNLRNLAFQSHDRGLSNEALRHILASLKFDAWDGLSNYLAGVLYHKFGDFSLARRHFQRALDAVQALPLNSSLADSDFTASQLAQMVRASLAKVKAQSS
jgi:chemotaxis methyl-accepting protein methylase